MNELADDISYHVWRTKYRYADQGISEHDIAETWRRIARALAGVELKDASLWEERFFTILQDFKFLPGGRIQAGAGTSRSVTLFNCFVLGTIDDSISGIFRALQESALTVQQGGHRRRFFHSAPQRYSNQRRGHHRLRSNLIHARVGCYVRHHFVHWNTSRRHDGHAALRSP